MEEIGTESPDRKKQRQGDVPEGAAAVEEHPLSLATQYQSIILAPLDRKNRRGRAKYLAALVAGELPDDKTIEAEQRLLDKETDEPWLQHVETAALVPPLSPLSLPPTAAASHQQLAAIAPAQTSAPVTKSDKSK